MSDAVATAPDRRPQQVENGIRDVAHVGLTRTASGIHGDGGLDERPLRVGQVARVLLSSHTLFYAAEQLETHLSDSFLMHCYVRCRISESGSIQYKYAYNLLRIC